MFYVLLFIQEILKRPFKVLYCCKYYLSFCSNHACVLNYVLYSHSNSLQNPIFQSYLIQVAENIDPAKDTDASSTRLHYFNDFISKNF